MIPWGPWELPVLGTVTVAQVVLVVGGVAGGAVGLWMLLAWLKRLVIRWVIRHAVLVGIGSVSGIGGLGLDLATGGRLVDVLASVVGGIV